MPRHGSGSSHARHSVLCTAFCALACGTGQPLPPEASPRPAADDCWDVCRALGYFCEPFCCQPLDGAGNPSCWDPPGHFTYERCCLDPRVRALVEPPEPPTPPLLRVGAVVLPLYRGPSDYNSPKVNERTVEVALGLWFMRRCVSRMQQAGGGFIPLEVGNVLGHYWPREDRIGGRAHPWQVLDLEDNSLDATLANYSGAEVLSISTIEHVGFDNEGTRRARGFFIGTSEVGVQAWLRSWDQGVDLLARIVEQASAFLLTWPVGFNPHLDSVVARTPRFRALARVARRLDVANNWAIDPDTSFAYGYDFRDTYDADHVGYLYDPTLWSAYKRVFGQAVLHAPKPLPVHPPFRFANAICIVTNVPELLA